MPFIESLPLPRDHWLYTGPECRPEGLVGLSDEEKAELRPLVRDAVKYAIKSATMNGTDLDFDPDVVVQNVITGLFGLNAVKCNDDHDDS
jgi:hypothetical protein